MLEEELVEVGFEQVTDRRGGRRLSRRSPERSARPGLAAAGAGGRPWGTERAHSSTPDRSHEHASPNAAFSVGGVSGRPRPDAASTIHGSTPDMRAAVSAKRLPSGENSIRKTLAPAGPARPFGPAGDRLERQPGLNLEQMRTVCPRVDAMSGKAQHRFRDVGDRRHRPAPSAIVFASGLSNVPGSGSASRISTIVFGGVRITAGRLGLSGLNTDRQRKSSNDEDEPWHAVRGGGFYQFEVRVSRFTAVSRMVPCSLWR